MSLFLHLVLLSSLAQDVVSTPPLPRLLVSLTPIFSEFPLITNSTNTPSITTITAVNVTLTLTGTPYFDPMLTLLLNSGNTKTQQYNATTLFASDSLGTLPLVMNDTTLPGSSNVQRFWSATERRPVGDIVINVLAIPPVELGVGSGPRIDLRRDQGGVVGMGEGFIPRPAVDEEWDVTVRWEGVESWPEGIRAVCSLGEGQEVRVQGRPGRVLARSYFAVGRLERWPPWADGDDGGDDGVGRFAMYWTGKLPWSVQELGERVERLTKAVGGFFGDRMDGGFRVFLRKAGMGYGGAGGYRSFMMEYTDLAAEELDAEGLENLIAHETVHEYALMNPARMEDTWYREGVAVYYAVVAPFLAGVVDKGYLVRWLNNNAQAYYTGGTTDLSWSKVLESYWTSTQLVRTSYFRGFVYLVQVQGLIAEATNGTKGLDDVVLELQRRYERQQAVQGEHFVEVLGGYIGKEAAENSLAVMKSGRLIVPATESLARFGLRMQRKDAEALQLGFSESSFGRKAISGLDSGSRAYEAGLREGDEIVRFWAFSTAGDALENKLKVVVRRQGQEVPIQYWPRSFEKVESYGWVDTATDL